MTQQRIRTISKVSIARLASGYRSSNALNNDLSLIEGAFENTLSRDGTGPNQMEAPLDMNNSPILNLPAPQTLQEPLRLGDVSVTIEEIASAVLPTKADKDFGNVNPVVGRAALGAQPTITSATSLRPKELYVDGLNLGVDWNSNITLTRNVVNPTAIYPHISNIQTGNGNNLGSTPQGISGGYFKVVDRTGITADQRGILYGLQLSVEPKFERNHAPIDDAVCLVVYNEGTAKATEAVYFGHNPALAKDFAAPLGIEAFGDYTAYITGDYVWGFNACLADGNRKATFSSGFIKLNNNIPFFVSRNAADTADINVFKVNTSNNLEIMGAERISPRDFTPTVTSDTGAFTSATVATARYSRDNGITRVTYQITVTTKGTGSGALIVSTPTTIGAYNVAVSGKNESLGTGLVGSKASATSVRLTRYDGVDPVNNGDSFSIELTYE